MSNYSRRKNNTWTQYKNGLRVDKTKIEVIEKLPPNYVNGVRTFLRYDAQFYSCAKDCSTQLHHKKGAFASCVYILKVQILLGWIHNFLGKGLKDKSHCHVSWKPPPSKTYKLNVDGSSFYGIIIRNSSGEWLLGCFGYCGHTLNMNVELKAIDCGLDIAWNVGFRSIICRFDSHSTFVLL